MTDFLQYTVTIKIDTGLIGHAFVTLQAPGQAPITVGYYPVVHSPSAPGIVKNDSVFTDPLTGLTTEHPSDWSRTFTVSAGQYEAMLNKVAFVSNHPGEYGVLGNQCTGFVRDVLNAGGITPSGMGRLVDGAAHPLNLRWAYGDMPANQVKPFRGNASNADALIEQINNGIANNPARLEQYKQDNLVPEGTGMPTGGGYWFGADLNDPQWTSATTITAQANALVNAAMPILLAGSPPDDMNELLAMQGKVAGIVEQHLSELGDDLKVYRDARGNVLVVGSNGAMQINRDGSIEAVNATEQGMVSTQYGAGGALSTSGTLNKTDGSYSQTLYGSNGQVVGNVTTRVLSNGMTQETRTDAQGRVLATTDVQTYDDGSRFEFKTEGGKTYIRATDDEGQVSAWREYTPPTSALTQAQHQATLLTDMTGFINALRSGDVVNRNLYGAKIALDTVAANGGSMGDAMRQLHDHLDGVSAAVGVVAGLHALQSSDTLTQLNGAVGLLGSANALAAYAGKQGMGSGAFLDKGSLGMLSTASALIAIANLKNLDAMLANGQVGSAAATVYTAYQGAAALYAASSGSAGFFAGMAESGAGFDPETVRGKTWLLSSANDGRWVMRA